MPRKDWIMECFITNISHLPLQASVFSSIQTYPSVQNIFIIWLPRQLPHSSSLFTRIEILPFFHITLWLGQAAAISQNLSAAGYLFPLQIENCRDIEIVEGWRKRQWISGIGGTGYDFAHIFQTGIRLVGKFGFLGKQVWTYMTKIKRRIPNKDISMHQTTFKPLFSLTQHLSRTSISSIIKKMIDHCRPPSNPFHHHLTPIFMNYEPGWELLFCQFIIELMQLYEIGKLIGTGSSGDVFLCKHITDKNYNYALKRIKIFEVDDKERENIENQLKILQKLRHINIVSYKDSFTDKEGNLCIVMVYCELGDMHSRIKQMKEKGRNFTEAQILDWLTQIALAIYYLHHQKILHRDLKSQNLFLKKDDRIKDDRIKLGDFGIAKVLDSTQDLARTCIGTPYYMAPEIFKYKPYSYKSDIWSLGIILYEMCNLRLPFEAQHYNALAMKILKGTFPSIMPTYSKQLRDLITSMLSRKTQERPSIVDILNKPFIRNRTEKYIGDLLSRSLSPADVDDIYLDTLKEQAVLLGVTGEEESIKKYPSSKDLEKKQLNPNKSYMTRRTEEEDNDLMAQYHSKRKSTFEKDYADRSRQQTSASSKALNLGYDFSDEKEAFVDHKKNSMMEREEKRSSLDLKKLALSKNNAFRVTVEYSMEEQNQFNNDPDDEIKTITETDSEQNHESSDEQQPPEGYNKSYYVLLDKIKLLKHRCETALGGNKYLRAYKAVNNGANKAAMLDILGPLMIGYWHLIDQIMFNESILKTLPKN